MLAFWNPLLIKTEVMSHDFNGQGNENLRVSGNYSLVTKEKDCEEVAGIEVDCRRLWQRLLQTDNKMARGYMIGIGE